MSKYGPEEAERRLNAMVDRYHDSLDGFYFFGNPLRKAIDASPALRESLLTSVAEGYLERIVNQAADSGAAAGYSEAEKSITLPEKMLDDRMRLIFALGHENQHALNTQGVAYRADVLFPALEHIRDSGQAPPRDYTQPLHAFIEHGREDEARAHIGGFNAVVSALRAEGKEPTAARIVDRLGARADDFFAPTGPGGAYETRNLQRSAQGYIAFTPENIDAMKTNYADKFPNTFGPNGLMDYRHSFIMEGLNAITNVEKIKLGQDLLAFVDGHKQAHAGQSPPSASMDPYRSVDVRVDFAALGANPHLLDVPANGELRLSNAVLAPNHTQLLQDHPDLVVSRQDARQRLGLPAEQAAQGFWSGLFGSSSSLAMAQDDVRAPDRQGGTLPQQIVEGMSGLKTIPGASEGEERRNVAAALALEAGKAGLASVDHVVVSRDGSRLIAIQGADPAAADARHVDVRIAEARQQPATESLQQLAEVARNPGAPSETQAPHKTMSM